MKMKKINYNDLKKEKYLKFYKFLFADEFNNLSDSAKILYTVFRDRLNLTLDSIEKGDMQWIDKNGNVFIKAGLENIMQFMNCARQKAVKLKKELVKHNLIEDVQTGITKSNKIYILEVDHLQDLDITLKFENQTSRSMKIKLQEVRKSYSNKNNIKKNNIKKNNKQYNQEKSNVNTNLEKNKNNFVVVDNQTASKNNLKENNKNKDNTNNKDITKELIQKVKSRYEKITQEKTTTTNIKELLQKTSENTINTYLDNIDNFEIKRTRAGFIRDAILGSWKWSEKKINKNQTKKQEQDPYYQNLNLVEENPTEVKL